MAKKVLWLFVIAAWVYLFVEADVISASNGASHNSISLNRLYLVGGALTWAGNVFLIKKSWIGWLLTAIAIICYTVSPALSGLWSAIFINGVTMIQKGEGIYKWLEKNGKKK